MYLGLTQASQVHTSAMLSGNWIHEARILNCSLAQTSWPKKQTCANLVRDVPFAEPAKNKHDYAGWAFNIEIS